MIIFRRLPTKLFTQKYTHNINLNITKYSSSN
jgi:hypothetical protein